MKMNNWISSFLQATMLFSLMLGTTTLLAEDQSGLTNKIESVDYSTLPGGRVSIRVKTTQPLANPPAGFTLTSPARIALDFPKVGNGLAKNNI
ncbi:MAG: secretin, partial [Methylotenera sp.]